MSRILEENLFRDAMVSLRRNRTRTLLSGAAVACGVFIMLFSIAGFNIFHNGSIGEISRLDLETAVVSCNLTTVSYAGFSSGREWNLDRTDVEALQSEFRNAITGSGPIYLFPDLQLVQTGNGRRDYVSVMATHPEICGLMQMSMLEGRFIDNLDMQYKRKVCVIGSDLSEQWFGGLEDPCGKDILVGNVMYTIVGVLKKDNPFIHPFGDEQMSVLLPYSTADAVYNLNGELSYLMFSMHVTEGFEHRMEDILCFLRQRHNVDPYDHDATNVESMQEYARILHILFGGTRVLIWVIFIGIIISSLLGVFGIMLLSVRERQGEIAIRLSNGAGPRDIVRQFVHESLTISILSSMTGVLMAELAIAAVRLLFSTGIVSDPLFGMPQLSFAGIIAVIVIVIAGGTLSGYLPAKKMAYKDVSALLNDIN